MSQTPSEAQAEPQGPRRARSRRVVATGVAVALGLAAGGGVWWHQQGGGGLPRVSPTTTYTFDPMSADNPVFSIGTFPIEANGQDVQILDVRPLTSSNLAVIGMDALWPTDNRIGAATEGFPAMGASPAHPVLNVVVPASEFAYVPKGQNEAVSHVLIEIGFRVLSGDVAALNGVTIKYRVGNHVKTELFRQAAIACIKPNPCGKNPDGSSDPDFADRALQQLGLLKS